MKEKNKVEAPEIEILPKVVQLQNLKVENIEISKIPIGMSDKDLQTVSYNFNKNFITLFTSKKLIDAAMFANNIEKLICNVKNEKTIILDYEKIMSKGDQNPEKAYSDLCEQIRAKKQPSEHTFIIICGIEKFLNSSSEIADELMEILELAKEKYSFLFVENAQKIKEYAYENWYKNYISNDSIVWIGDGIQNQYVLETNASLKELIEDCGRTFGYLNAQSKTIMVKLLGMEEEEASDE